LGKKGFPQHGDSVFKFYILKIEKGTGGGMRLLYSALTIFLTVLVSTTASARWISADHGKPIEDLAAIEFEMNQRFGVGGYYSAVAELERMDDRIQNMSQREANLTDQDIDALARKEELESYVDYLYPGMRETIEQRLDTSVDQEGLVSESPTKADVSAPAKRGRSFNRPAGADFGMDMLGGMTVSRN